MVADYLRDLIGSAVASFQQVEGYYYLVLDRAHVSLYNPLLEPPTPDDWGRAAVGSVVTDVELREAEWLSLSFSNGTQLKMSLRPETYVCPEAAVIVYKQRPKQYVVIQ